MNKYRKATAPLTIALSAAAGSFVVGAFIAMSLADKGSAEEGVIEFFTGAKLPSAGTPPLVCINGAVIAGIETRAPSKAQPE